MYIYPASTSPSEGFTSVGFRGGALRGENCPAGVGDWKTHGISRIQAREDPRQRGFSAGQYSLGKWITLLAKYSVISSSGKSVFSISLVNTTLPLPSSHVSVAVQ